MIPYQTNINLIKGTNYQEILSKSRKIFRLIESKSKRKPYIRSAYFKKQKIFFDYFWKHHSQKNRRIKFQRLKYFSAALNLIENSKNHPVSKQNPNDRGEVLHRFHCLTREKYLFCVQIKEVKRSGTKYFMSVFAPD